MYLIIDATVSMVVFKYFGVGKTQENLMNMLS